jgi:hypothetical protein
MQPTKEDVESTMRTSQQVLDQGETLQEQFARGNADLAKLSADWQAEVERMSEVVNSPKATAQLAEQYLAALKEMQTEMTAVDALLNEAQAPASGSPGAKPSRHRGMRV